MGAWACWPLDNNVFCFTSLRHASWPSVFIGNSRLRASSIVSRSGGHHTAGAHSFQTVGQKRSAMSSPVKVPWASAMPQDAGRDAEPPGANAASRAWQGGHREVATARRVRDAVARGRAREAVRARPCEELVGVETLLLSSFSAVRFARSLAMSSPQLVSRLFRGRGVSGPPRRVLPQWVDSLRTCPSDRLDARGSAQAEHGAAGDRGA